MASINFSGVSNVLEAAPALVNFKFDFSLRKVEVPPEFRELGHLLNSSRRDNAENGKLHITARRLGVLFEGVTPSTPALIKAYGLRASEIAKAIEEEDKSQSFSYGIFSDHAGFDAASIWAGATSGTGAIQVHLLACMLARIWSSSEAISIWAELLDVRRKKIMADFESTGSADLQLLSEARQSLDRRQLAEWDASARAWLRVADNTKNRQQKKLLLIITNLSQPVNSKPILYDGVIRAWVAGLNGMEALISGTPSDMESGELFLALSSWHIYPNMLVLEPFPQTVEQKDPLVPASGTLTIGLRRRISTTTDSGLHWSLPLAHLQYYGDPEIKQGKLTRLGQRLSLPEFNMAVLGCVLGSWEIKHSDLVSAVDWIRKLSEIVEGYFWDHTKTEDGREPGMSTPLPLANHFNKTWLSYLGNTARAFLESTDLQRQIFTQLLKLGKSRSMFLGSPRTTFFGFSGLKTATLLATTEQKVRLYRLQAAALGVSHRDAIIHYVSPETGHDEFASATVETELSKKRTCSGDEIKHSNGHCRWVRSKPLALPLGKMDTQTTTLMNTADISCGSDGTNWDEQPIYSNDASGLTFQSLGLEHLSTDADKSLPGSSDCEIKRSDETSCLKSAEENFAAQSLRYNAMGEVVRPVETEPLEAFSSDGASWVEWGIDDPSQPWIPKDVETPGNLTDRSDLCSYHKGDGNLNFSLPERSDLFSDLERSDLFSDLERSDLFSDPERSDLSSVPERSYKLWLGSPDSTAIYMRNGLRQPGDCSLSLADLHILLDERAFTVTTVMQALKKNVDATKPSYISSLRTLATVSEMYSNFRGATIDVNVLSSPVPLKSILQDLDTDDKLVSRQDHEGTCQEETKLSHAENLTNNRAGTPQSDHADNGSVHCGFRCDFFCELCFTTCFRFRPMTSRMSFSCILWFESTLRMNSEVLDTAIALSSGNSLFIATAVTCDPARSANRSQVQHVMGNVGRPGISILVPPEKPHVKKLDLERWHLLNFAAWDGRPGNSFPESSLHVWFTGATQEIDIGNRGRQDKELMAVESVVSLHSRGEWVTDLPIQAAKEALRTAKPWIVGLTAPDVGESSTAVLPVAGPALQCPKMHDREFRHQQFPLAAITNWDELLDTTLAAEQDCIFLAQNNWQARLAALMIALARDKKVYLLPPYVCWECTREDYASDVESAQTVLFIA